MSLASRGLAGAAAEAWAAHLRPWALSWKKKTPFLSLLLKFPCLGSRYTQAKAFLVLSART